MCALLWRITGGELDIMILLAVDADYLCLNLIRVFPAEYILHCSWLTFEFWDATAGGLLADGYYFLVIAVLLEISFPFSRVMKDILRIFPYYCLLVLGLHVGFCSVGDMLIDSLRMFGIYFVTLFEIINYPGRTLMCSGYFPSIFSISTTWEFIKKTGRLFVGKDLDDEIDFRRFWRCWRLC